MPNPCSRGKDKRQERLTSSTVELARGTVLDPEARPKTAGLQLAHGRVCKAKTQRVVDRTNYPTLAVPASVLRRMLHTVFVVAYGGGFSVQDLNTDGFRKIFTF